MRRNIIQDSQQVTVDFLCALINKTAQLIDTLCSNRRTERSASQ